MRNNGDSQKCSHSRAGEIRHLCDPHSCGMPSLLRKYREVHKSVSRTIVRHRVAHYVLLAGPPRAREDPEPRLSDWNRIPFRRSAFLGFFATNPAPSPSRSRVLASKRPRPSVLVARSSGNEGTRGEAGGGWAIHEETKTTKWRSKEVKKWARMDNGLAQSVTRKSRWARIICKSTGAPLRSLLPLPLPFSSSGNRVACVSSLSRSENRGSEIHREFVPRSYAAFVPIPYPLATRAFRSDTYWTWYIIGFYTSGRKQYAQSWNYKMLTMLFFIF